MLLVLAPEIMVLADHDMPGQIVHLLVGFDHGTLGALGPGGIAWQRAKISGPALMAEQKVIASVMLSPPSVYEAAECI